MRSLWHFKNCDLEGYRLLTKASDQANEGESVIDKGQKDKVNTITGYCTVETYKTQRNYVVL